MQPIRVLVIDDSAFMRKMLTDILNSDARIEVVGTARNGKDGVKKTKYLSPDVVTMDVNMPVLDGISALDKIMREHPIPVIMLSSRVEDGTEDTIKAMEKGAVDFIMKPSGEISLDIKTIQQEIIAKIIAAKEAKLPLSISNPENKSIERGMRSSSALKRNKGNKTMIAIGTSTGGPRALQKVLTDLPANFSIPILIVQHMPPLFTKSLAKRLHSLSNLNIKEAIHGELIQKGTVYIAPGDYHMVVEPFGKSFAIKLTKEERINNHRPSVDALFTSIAKVRNINKIAVVLTGMGSDGTLGIRKLKKLDDNTTVITESEETAVIYGMPKAAYETGLADVKLPLSQIGHYLSTMNRCD